jgi:hypothetical protein
MPLVTVWARVLALIQRTTSLTEIVTFWGLKAFNDVAVTVAADVIVEQSTTTTDGVPPLSLLLLPHPARTIQIMLSSTPKEQTPRISFFITGLLFLFKSALWVVFSAACGGVVDFKTYQLSCAALREPGLSSWCFCGLT